MEVYKLAPNVEFIDVSPPIYGFRNFIGVYVLRGEKIALIDVGPLSSQEKLFAGLKESGIALTDINYILVTHIHLDHIGNLGEAMRQMPNAVAIVHEKGKPHLIAPARLWESSQQTLGELAIKYGQPTPVPEDKLIAAKDAMRIDLGSTDIEVLLSPGHASHHLNFLDIKERRLFVGDSVGVYIEDIDLIRPDTPSPLNLDQALSSLDKLIGVSPASLCFTHFGCVSNAVERLRSHKQRMALWGRIIAEHLADEADWQTVYEEIKKTDKVMERLNLLPPDLREREFYFIERSIAGYINYFKKYGTEFLKAYTSLNWMV